MLFQVVKYAKAYGNDEACKKFDVRKDELQVKLVTGFYGIKSTS